MSNFVPFLAGFSSERCNQLLLQTLSWFVFVLEFKWGNAVLLSNFYLSNHIVGSRMMFDCLVFLFLSENMVLASVLPVIGCILLLCAIITVLVIIKCRRRRRSAVFKSSIATSFSKPLGDALTKPETNNLPMRTRNNVENDLLGS